MKKLLMLIFLLFTSFVFATDMNDFKLVKTLNDSTGHVLSISFSPNGRYLASGGQDKTVKIYDTNNWQLIKTISDHSGIVWVVSFSPNGKYLASGSWDKTVKIYDTNNWQLIKTLRDHSKKVTSISSSSDGRYFASCSKHTVKIYDTNNWQLVKTLKNQSGSVSSVSFNSDGRTLTYSANNTIKTYKIPLIESKRFIKKYVEDHINEWQKKGEFEKTYNYNFRLIKRDEKIKDFTNEAKRMYGEKAQEYWEGENNVLFAFILNGDIKILSNYDADKETFKLNISTIGDVVVNIPINYAKSFKENEIKLKLQNPKVVRKGDEFVFSSIEIYNPVDKKSFVCNIK